MKMTIAQRFHPFSHRPGNPCLLPLSTWKAIIYPTRLFFQHIDDPSKAFTLDLALQGPVKGFTIAVDLERGRIRVFGTTPKGYFSYAISRSSEGILFTFEKVPLAFLDCMSSSDKISRRLSNQETLLIRVPPEAASAAIPATRLSLGMHKSQDWDLVLRRFDLKEMLPFLMRFGATLPTLSIRQETFGTFALLNQFRKACQSANKLEALIACEQWLRGSFTGILMPTLNDSLFQGLIPFQDSIPENHSALPHLIEGSHLIRSLFFQEKEEYWEFLPCLLPIFDSGRMIQLMTEQKEILAIEWSKHQIKKVVIHTHNQRKQVLKFPKEIRSFRFRQSLREKGITINLQTNRFELDLPPRVHLFLDRFKK
jgi:hypothetical protein